VPGIWGFSLWQHRLVILALQYPPLREIKSIGALVRQSTLPGGTGHALRAD